MYFYVYVLLKNVPAGKDSIQNPSKVNSIPVCMDLLHRIYKFCCRTI